MTPCPRCGASDWKPVTEQRQFVYKICSNCKYSPALASAEIHNAKDWIESVAKEREAAYQEFAAREAEVRAEKKPTTLQHGRLNRAIRIMSAADKKMILADAVSEVVGATESGQITLLIPEIGLFQFEWGNFDLFKAIGS